jgi:hypothetical protein
MQMSDANCASSVNEQAKVHIAPPFKELRTALVVGGTYQTGVGESCATLSSGRFSMSHSR